MNRGKRMKYDTAKLLLAKIARAERASDFSAWHAMSAAGLKMRSA
jgi:hypothetical protein